VCKYVCLYSTGDANLAKDRAEHAAMKKKRVQERATEQEKIKARRMQAGQVSFKAAAEKRVSSHGSAHASWQRPCLMAAPMPPAMSAAMYY
jgi:hypothetical protein